jgi:hypothetical protein
MKNQTYILLIALIALSTVKSFGQITTSSNTPSGVSPEYVGWDGFANIPLDILTTNADNIDFYTGSTFRMTLLGANGFLGIGLTAPNFRLTVQDDINLIPGGFPNFGYRWEDSVILKTNFVIDNIFLGSMAGFNAGAGTANTFLGAFSGRMHSGNNGGNTFVGWNAGSVGDNVGEITKQIYMV